MAVSDYHQSDRSVTAGKYPFRKLAIPLTSLAILIFLTLQVYAIFAHVSPRLWPFLDYPMYKQARYAGETLNQYFLFGILKDLTEVPIFPGDLGLDFWKFEQGPVLALRRKDREKLKTYVQLYQSRHNKQLVSLRLENHPLVLSREGASAAPPQVLEHVNFETVRREE